MNRIRELLNLIRTAKYYRKRVKRDYGSLTDKKARIILDGRSVDEWIKVYDDYISDKRRLFMRELKILASKSLIIAFPIIVILLFTIMLLYSGSQSATSGMILWSHDSNDGFLTRILHNEVISVGDGLHYSKIDSVLLGGAYSRDKKRITYRRGLLRDRLLINDGNEILGSRNSSECNNCSEEMIPNLITGKIDGVPALEAVAGRGFIHASYDTRLSVSAVSSPVSTTITYDLFNNKSINTTFLVVPEDSAVKVWSLSSGMAEQDVMFLGRTEDFLDSWNNDPLFVSVKKKLSSVGASIDNLPSAVIPNTLGDKGSYKLLAFSHPENSWARIKVVAPTSGRVLILDPAGSWWNSSWTYRKPIIVSENSATNLLGYSIRIELNNSNFDFSKANSDGSDIRLSWNTTNSSGDNIEVALPLWIESWDLQNNESTLWTLLPALNASSNETIYLYYGNSFASSVGDPDSVFDLFINFSRDGVFSYANQDATPTQYEVLNDTSLHLWGNTWKYSPRSFVVVGDGSQVLEYWYDNLGPVGEIHGSGFDSDNSLSSSQTYRIYGTQNWGIVGDSVYSGPSGWEFISESLDEYGGSFDRLFFVSDDDANSATNATFKNVRVRNYTSPEPSLTFGSEERVELLNATLTNPNKRTRVYRGDSLYINGSIICERGDCGNISAWSELYSSISPLVSWTEDSTSDFLSYNTSVNTSISQGKVSITASQSDWFDSLWNYREKINISNPNSALTNYTVKLSINTSSLINSGKMNGDCSDMRFTNSSGDLLNYWIEDGCNTSSTTVWVRMPYLAASTNTSLYLYYGNSFASSVGDPDSVFDLFINFSRDGVFSYANQDATPTQYEVLNDTSLHLWGNTWKYSPRSFVVVGDGSQVLEYWYDNLGPVGEIHGSGFDSDNSLSSSQTYRIYGTQNWGIVGDSVYSGPSGWEFISESLDEYGGSFDRLFFVSDDDANSATNATFKNVRVRQLAPVEPSVSYTSPEEAVLFRTSATYVSDAYDTGSSSSSFKNIYWFSSLPENTSLSVYTRSSNDNSSWSPWFLEVNDTSIDAPDGRFLQYKVELQTTNNSLSPELDKIVLNYIFTTTGWDILNSESGISAQNPFACGVLNFSDSCNASWDATAQYLGLYALRVYANSSKDNTITAYSQNHSVEVYARTYITNQDSSPSVQLRDDNVTITARLIDDLSSPISGMFINFTDITSGSYIGNTTTDSNGYATIKYTIPSDAAYGTHQVNISFPENSTMFLEASYGTISFKVSSMPNVSYQQASKELVGIGESVLLSANVTDDIGIDKVWVTITYPDSSSATSFMSGSGNGNYTLLFTDTWIPGTYTFKVSANNTDGITYDPEGNFTINSTAEIFVDPVSSIYRNFETVELSDRRIEDWWNASWLYRMPITITGSTSDLSEYQVPLIINTSYFISQNKMQPSCDDIRFVSSTSIYKLPVNITNTLGVPFSGVMPITISDSSITSKMVGVRVFEQEQSDPYAAESMPFYLDAGSSYKIWINTSLGTGESKTIYIYYGDKEASDLSNYLRVFKTPIGISGITAAGSSWNTTNFSTTIFSSDPVVIGSLMSVNDAAEAALRLDNVSSLGFQAKAEESASLDGVHSSELIGYLAIKEGSWWLGSGLLSASMNSISSPTGNNYNTLSFGASYSSTPAIFSQVMTFNEQDPVHTRMNNPSATGVDVKLEESTDTAHSEENISLVAISQGSFLLGNISLETGSLSTTHVAASIPTSLTSPSLVSKIMTENGGDNSHERVDYTIPSTRVEEEASFDGPHTTETLSWLAADEGIIYGAPVTSTPDISFGSESVVSSRDVLVDYAILSGCNTTNTSIIVQPPMLEANSNTTIYMYYGNPSAATESNLSSVYMYDSPQIIGYVVANTFSSVDIYSLLDNNTVSAGASSSNLDKGSSLSSPVSPGDFIKAMGPVQVDSSDDSTDIIVPSSWAGNEFLYAFHRDTDRIDLLSPWGSANVSIFDGGTLLWNGTVSGSVVEVTNDITNGNVARIVSDLPILAYHYTTSNGDAMPLYPATASPIFGVPTTWLTIASGPSGAVVIGNSSGSTQTSWSLTANASYESGGYGGDANEAAYRLDPQGSLIGALQQADSDGRESTAFLPEVAMGTLFGSSKGADYIIVAAPAEGTNCTVYDSSGSVVGSGTSSGNSLVSRIGFGTGNDNLYVSGGWSMICDAPVWAMFDEAVKNDETHLMSYAQLRQYYYPEPRAFPSYDEESALTGLRNTGSTNLTGYLYLAVQENSTGSWQTITPPVYQDFSKRTIVPGELVNLSKLWSDSGSWSTSDRSPGWYRVYAALLDNNSNVITDGNGNQLFDTGLFRIIKAIIRMTNLTHENQPVNEYEAGDFIDWVNVTVEALNNTAINAEVNLMMLKDGSYPGWGPNSAKSCGNIPPGSKCENQWNNGSYGYPVPVTVPSGTYTFNWGVNATADNANDYYDNSLTIQIHNVPSTFSAALKPERIYTSGSPAYYNFSFVNLWSQQLTNVNVSINCPEGAGLNCSCDSGGGSFCFFSSVASGANTTSNFSISANSSSTSGDYYINATVYYENPRENKVWFEQVPLLLEVRLEGVLAITVNEYPEEITRGGSGIIRAYIQNTAANNASNAMMNYTLPSGWSNSTPLGKAVSVLEPDQIMWNNLSFVVGSLSSLGPQDVRIDSKSDEGQEDFKFLSITVYANTSIPYFALNDTNISRDEYLLLTARILRDDNQPVSGESVGFYDQTSGRYLGSAVTNSTGYASLSTLVNSSFPLGINNLSANYSGSVTAYLNPSSVVSYVDVGLKPSINSLSASPDPQGAGGNVTIIANITDDDGVSSASLSVTLPNSTEYTYPLSFSGGLYRSSFNKTWHNGTYYYRVSAVDAVGSVSSSSSSFMVASSGFINLTLTNNTYSQTNDVLMVNHTNGWWFNRLWPYKKVISINHTASGRSNLTLDFDIDTSSLISSGHLRSDCADLRFYNNHSPVNFSLANCGSVNTTIRVLFSLMGQSPISLMMFYGNGSASPVNLSSEDVQEFTAYVDSATLATSNLKVASLEDGNIICLHNGTTSCQSADQSDVLSFPASSLSTNSYITATKPFSSGFDYTDTGDSMTPLGVAGTDFVIPAPRGSQILTFVAPFEDANVKVYDSSGSEVGNINISAGSANSVSYNFVDNTGIIISANTSVLAHYEAGTEDYMPLVPADTELYGLLSAAASADEVACLEDSTTITAYYSNGTTLTFSCNRGDSIDLGSGGTQGTGPGVHVVSDKGVGGSGTADGDGTESVVWLRTIDMGADHVLPQTAEYLSVLPITPDTKCDLYSPSGSLIGSQTSTSYSPPRPQNVIRFTGSPISAGSRLVCNNTVYAYYEYDIENGETNLFGSFSYASRISNYSYSSGSELSYSSLLANTGPVTLSGYLLMVVENNASGYWSRTATIIDYMSSNNMTSLSPGGYIDLGSLWNQNPWNVGNSQSGDYRVRASLLDPYGSVIMSSSIPYEPIQGYGFFNITPPNIKTNITAITVYDVTDSLNKHIYSSELLKNSTNDTFILEAGRDYRVEVHVFVDGNSDPWIINQSEISYQLLNSSWIINSGDIWYKNGSDSSERNGGVWNGSVTWNSSLNGVGSPGSEVVFYYVINLSGASAERRSVNFVINDPLFSESDWSVFRIIEPDTAPPKIFNNTYGLSDYEVIRGNSTLLFGRWDEELANATASYNSTLSIMQDYFISLPNPNPYNWSNYTISTDSLWLLGHHAAKLSASDLLDNWNTTLYYIDFTVWGLANIDSISVSNSTPNMGDNITITCSVRDSTNNALISGYIVEFRNGSSVIGTNTTNSSGYSSLNYTDYTPGSEDLYCVVYDDSALYYKEGTNNISSVSITTKELEPPTWSSISGPSRAYKGDTISLSTFWSDNLLLDTATLFINESGLFINSGSQAMSGSSFNATFNYQIPVDTTSEVIGWYQKANDTSGNENQTVISSIEVWSWAGVDSITLNPASMYLGNTTNITCLVTDQNSSSPISNYIVAFYNSTGLMGYNTTNTSGYARYFYTDNTTGTETITCLITYNTSRRINVSSDQKSATLNTVFGGDIIPPVLTDYGLNSTTEKKGTPILLYAHWNESINSSTVYFNVSAQSLVEDIVPLPYTDFWTNYTILSNKSWSVGPHRINIHATDQNGNENSTTDYLYFNLTATLNISWVSPNGDQNPGLLNFTCLVLEEQGGSPASNYPVYFYDGSGSLIGSSDTNSSGYAVLAYDASSLSGANDFSCRIFSDSSRFYYLGYPFSDETVLYFDTSAPEVSLQNPLNNTDVESFSVDFNFTASDDHDTSMICNLTLDGSVIENDIVAPNGTMISTSKSVSEGLHYWNVTCVDDAGNSGISPTYNFNMTNPDTKSPTVDLISPSGSFLNSSSVSFEYNTTDDSGVSNCSLYLDGSLNTTDNSVNEGLNSLVVQGLEDGSHYWYMVCDDVAGNSNTSSTAGFIVDTQPPAPFSLVSPANNTITHDLYEEMIWNETSDSNFDNYTLQLSLFPDFREVKASYYSLSASTTKVNVSFEENKMYYWRVIAYDKAGLSYATEPYIYITDFTGPSVLLISPGPGAFSENNTVTFRFSVSDYSISGCSLYTNETGIWAVKESNSTISTSGTYEFISTLPQNSTVLWNVVCNDSMGQSSFAASNRTIYTGPSREFYNNQTIPVNLTVNNTAPKVIVSSPQSIYLVAGGLTSVTCQANVSDGNGVDDIKGVNATFYASSSSWFVGDNNESHYTNESCVCSVINSSTSYCECSFNIFYYVTPGSWYCRVEARDDSGLTSSGISSSTVQTLRALSLLQHSIDYGNLSTGEISNETNTTIQNLGNTPIDLSLFAYGSSPDDGLAMVCDEGTIATSYERYSLTGGPYNSMSPVSGSSLSRSLVDITIPKQTNETNRTKDLSWRLKIPDSASGVCTGSLVFQAEADT